MRSLVKFTKLAARPVHTVRIHTIKEPGSRNSGKFLWLGEVHTSKKKLDQVELPNSQILSDFVLVGRAEDYFESPAQQFRLRLQKLAAPIPENLPRATSRRDGPESAFSAAREAARAQPGDALALGDGENDLEFLKMARGVGGEGEVLVSSHRLEVRSFTVRLLSIVIDSGANVQTCVLTTSRDLEFLKMAHSVRGRVRYGHLWT